MPKERSGDYLRKHYGKNGMKKEVLGGSGGGGPRRTQRVSGSPILKKGVLPFQVG